MPASCFELRAAGADRGVGPKLGLLVRISRNGAPRRNAACREAAAMAYGAVMGGMVPKTDPGNSHLDGSLRVIRLRRPLYGTSMPGAGAVHHIKDRPLAPCCMSAFAGCGHGASHALGGNGRTAWAKSCLSRCKKDQVKARHPAPTAMGCRLMRPGSLLWELSVGLAR